MVKHTQTICRQFADELVECVRPFCGVGAWRVNFLVVAFLQRYKGQFVDDKRHGYGVYSWPDGRCFKGNFENNKKSGFGVYSLANGDRFEVRDTDTSGFLKNTSWRNFWKMPTGKHSWSSP